MIAKLQISYSCFFGKGNESERAHLLFLSTLEVDVYVLFPKALSTVLRVL